MILPFFLPCASDGIWRSQEASGETNEGEQHVNRSQGKKSNITLSVRANYQDMILT